VGEIINGKNISNQILDDLKLDIINAKERYNIVPHLGIILVGDDRASSIYVNNKIRVAKIVGINTTLLALPTSATTSEVIEHLRSLNNDSNISGIIVQLPLPKHIDTLSVMNFIDPNKDVDGFHPLNVGKLYGNLGRGFVPCTANGCLTLIKSVINDLAGKKVVIIGRSNIVGKPLASLLLSENATVTIAHSYSRDLQAITLTADVVVSAIGRPNFFGSDFFNENAIVIDVGISQVQNEDGSFRVVGDVKFDEVSRKVAYLSPVPGGVGPMTIAYLLKNTYDAMIIAGNATYASG
jgi:methylenetetrahydrofolate dehydrogenase (NADP+)/methenyltetrahydrofolate cyclohydrolase